MALSRNLGKLFTNTSAAGVGGSPLSAGFGASTARRFSSWSTSSLKREFQELLAESKELSFRDYLQLTFGTTVVVVMSWRPVYYAMNGVKKICSRVDFANLKFEASRDGAGSGRDGDRGSGRGDI